MLDISGLEEICDVIIKIDRQYQRARRQTPLTTSHPVGRNDITMPGKSCNLTSAGVPKDLGKGQRGIVFP